MYKAWAQYARALEYFKQAISIFEELDLINNVASLLNNIGAVYYNQKNYKQAAEYFNNSIVIK